MRGHSIEIKSLHMKNQHRLTSETPEAYSSVCGFFPKAEQETKLGLRRCESASTLAKRPKSTAQQSTQRLTMLETKYKALEEDYRKVLQSVKDRSELFIRQKEEIDRLTQITQKEEKEIERLKLMLRINEKKSQTAQTEEQIEDSTWRKRIEVSTG